MESEGPNERIYNTAIIKYENVDGKEYTEKLQQLCKKVIYWKKNFFLLPTERAGKSIIDEIVRLLSC